MKLTTRALLAAASISLLSLSATLSAQAKKPAASRAGSCGIRSSDPWVIRQAAFFDDTKHDWTDDTLRTALLTAAGITETLKAPVHLGVQIIGVAPALGPTANAMTMIDNLKKLAATRGSTWPTRSVVGAAGTHAVYLLAQTDTGLGRAALKRMMEAGPDESPAIDVAVFEDHMRLIWGRKQLYGTQFQKRDGKITLAPMEDSAHADLRREDAGLPPFKLGVCLAQEQK